MYLHSNKPTEYCMYMYIHVRVHVVSADVQYIQQLG